MDDKTPGGERPQGFTSRRHGERSPNGLTSSYLIDPLRALERLMFSVAEGVRCASIRVSYAVRGSAGVGSQGSRGSGYRLRRSYPDSTRTDLCRSMDRC